MLLSMVVSFAPFFDVHPHAGNRAAGAVGHKPSFDAFGQQRATGFERRIAGALDQCLAQVGHAVARPGRRVVRGLDVHAVLGIGFLTLTDVVDRHCSYEPCCVGELAMMAQCPRLVAEPLGCALADAGSQHLPQRGIFPAFAQPPRRHVVDGSLKTA